ncbi:MAG: hypothetical protein KGY74_08425 [Candidatus Cloacimonetes bacterium]|nr:hypothetical protein [Candidatus Cloacimonadota bacterium]
MPYATRNTIVLICIAVLLLAGIFILNGSKSSELKEVKADNADMQKKLDDLEKSHPDLDDQQSVLDELSELEKRSLAKNKLIPNKNTPVITYKYLLQICHYYCPNFNFNFNMNKQGEINNVPYNSYSLNGTSDLGTLYSFIYQLETQQLLTTIESINLNPQVSEFGKADTVNYNIKFNAYYKEDGTKLSDIPFNKNNYKYLSANPFTPKIHLPDLSKLEPFKIYIEKSKLIGLTDKIAFIETQDGRIEGLSPGDEVAFGSLKRIDTENNRAIFIINKIGVRETVILEFNKE